MKKIFLALLAVLCISSVCSARSEKIIYCDAAQMGILGKIDKVTPNPYHRVNTELYKGMTKDEARKVKCSAGLAIAFRTNAKSIWIRAQYGYKDYGCNTMGISLRGYDLYVKQDTCWLWAGAACPKLKSEGDEFPLVENMDGSEKTFLLYLPIYSELEKLEIGVNETAHIKGAENPFHGRIGVFGSSFTQGIGTSRPGMSWPAQLGRSTGLGLLNLGVSGRCLMQDYFANVLCEAEVDAFIFDTFSNPGADVIKKRLFDFIEKVQKAHPGIPLIFQQTIYRERRNFNTEVEKYESEKMDMAEELMEKACKKFKNVYFVRPDATSANHETSTDGIHPNDYGYTLWADSVRQQILDILAQYDIK